MKLAELAELKAVLEQNPNHESHRDALAKTGFWGNQGAGCVVIAKGTGRILMPHRSPHVEQPNTWGTWGGAIDGQEDPLKAALREFEEESSMSSSMVVETFPLYVFKHQSGFQYHNFLVVIKEEFEPTLDWETQGSQWVEFGEWPGTLHFGFQGILNDAASVKIIKEQIAVAKS
jgi:8-oxo-dGTP pyrophosphatase MutT (NUDIX family)